MASEWRVTSLGQCAAFLSGGTPSKNDPALWSGPIPWVSAKDMKSFRLADAADHISPAALGQGGKTVPSGTVLLLVRGMTLHNDVPICLTQREMAFNQDIKALRAAEGVDGEFLAYWLLAKKPELLAAVDSAGHGTGRLVTDTLKSMTIRLPPLNVQREIAQILGALDDKIELNRRMNATLEAMARALFQSWFVDFDPVRASAEQLISEGTLEVGDGYRAKNSELQGPGLPFVRAGNLKDGFELASAEILNEVSVARAGSKVSRPGDVAFTSKGTIGRIARVSELDPQFVYSPQICYWRSLDPSRLEPTILYCWMQSLDFRSQVDAVAGQTDMAPYVSLRDQRAMEVPIFPESQRALARRLELLLSRQFHAGAESARLASLRDTLLPNLLRGDLAAGCVDRPSNTSSTSISSTTGITNKRNSTTSTTTTQQHSSTVSRP